jgi:hypothetical protein
VDSEPSLHVIVSEPLVSTRPGTSCSVQLLGKPLMVDVHVPIEVPVGADTGQVALHEGTAVPLHTEPLQVRDAEQEEHVYPAWHPSAHEYPLLTDPDVWQVPYPTRALMEPARPETEQPDAQAVGIAAPLWQM